MPENNNNIKNSYVVSLAIFVCILVIVFETAQQYFYFKFFEINAIATFLDLLLSQTRKWLVWIIYALPLWIYIKWLVAQDQLNTSLVFRTILLIITLLLLVVATMATIEVSIADNTLFSLSVWLNYLIFYMFQKVPIYSFGYTLLSLVFYLYFKNNQLIVQMLKLSELNQKDFNNFNKNNTTEDQNTNVLKIKVGNSFKILAVMDIDWIEADDYCVNIHSQDNEAVYSMRTTLKSLEQILPSQFVRVHRSAIVNMSCVSEYKTQGGSMVKMQNGEEVAVAQSKIKQIKEYFSIRD